MKQGEQVGLSKGSALLADRCGGDPRWKRVQ